MKNAKHDHRLEALIRDPKISVYREHFLEHMFIAEFIQAAWLEGVMLMISRTEYDGWGYDLTIDGGGVVRYVQLKAKTRGGHVRINGRLGRLKGACVVLMIPSVSESGEVRLRYRLYHRSKDQPISVKGLKTAKFTRYVKDVSGIAVRKERKGHFNLPVGKFTKPMSSSDLVKMLFK